MNATKLTMASLILLSASSAFADTAGPGVDDRWIRAALQSVSVSAPAPAPAAMAATEFKNIPNPSLYAR
jgi:hypothetical protein